MVFFEGAEVNNDDGSILFIYSSGSAAHTLLNTSDLNMTVSWVHDNEIP